MVAESWEVMGEEDMVVVEIGEEVDDREGAEGGEQEDVTGPVFCAPTPILAGGFNVKVVRRKRMCV